MTSESTIWTRRIKPALEIIQALGILLAGIGLVVAASQLTLAGKSESATLGLQFEDRMSQGVMLGISDAVQSVPETPILQINRGKFTEDQLDEYLGNYDTLYYLHEESLINDQMLDDLFCSDVEAASKDSEITDYLKTDRAAPDSGADYIGFDKLAKYCIALDNSLGGKALQN